jgi:predicted nucleic acid-binding protein
MKKLRLLLDTNLLGQLCHPKTTSHKPLVDWIKSLRKYQHDIQVCVPEIADYELRRKLLHLIKTQKASEKSLDRLNCLIVKPLDNLPNSEEDLYLEYLPLTTNIMRKAAELWAEARSKGFSTAPEPSLDGDVILAAQALEVSGIVVTLNRKHLSRFVEAKDWQEISLPP